MSTGGKQGVDARALLLIFRKDYRREVVGSGVAVKAGSFENCFGVTTCCVILSTIVERLATLA